MDPIFSSLEFWQKLASSEAVERPVTQEDQVEQLHGFIDGFKEAGANSAETFGFLMELAEFFGFEKTADDAAAPAAALAQKVVGAGENADFMEGAGHTLAAPAQNLWNTIRNPATWKKNYQEFLPDLKNPATYANPLGAMVPRGLLPNPLTVNKAMDDGTNFAKSIVTSPDRELPKNFEGLYPTVAAGMEAQHPDLTRWGTRAFGGGAAGRAQALNVMARYGRGEYGQAFDGAWNGLKSNELVSRIAPYVIPGLASMAAGKMMGLGWGGALGAGVLGGMAGNYAHGQGWDTKMQAGMNDWVNKHLPENPADAAAKQEAAATAARAAAAKTAPAVPATPGAAATHEQLSAINASVPVGQGVAPGAIPGLPPPIAPAGQPASKMMFPTSKPAPPEQE